MLKLHVCIVNKLTPLVQDWAITPYSVLTYWLFLRRKNKTFILHFSLIYLSLEKCTCRIDPLYIFLFLYHNRQTYTPIEAVMAKRYVIHVYSHVKVTVGTSVYLKVWKQFMQVCGAFWLVSIVISNNSCRIKTKIGWIYVECVY